MAEESPVLSPPADESIEAETGTPLESELESREPTPEPTSEPDFVCDCEEWGRSACKGLPFYGPHQSRRYCVLHYPGKEKSTDFKTALDNKLSKKDFDFRGVWFPNEVWFGYFEFSAAASFFSATFSSEANFSHAAFSAEADFRYASFSAAADFSRAAFRADADFSDAAFSTAADFSRAAFSTAADFSRATFRAAAGFRSVTFGTIANFRGAEFNAAASFISATFSATASFISATFSGAAYFTDATFSDADFDSAKFIAGAHFLSVTFSADADFSPATFGAAANFNLSVFHARADFGGAYFNDSLHFFGSATERQLKDGANLAARTLGKDPSLDFQHIRIEHPERIVFHTLKLRPLWFVNVDSRRFVFTDVSWQWDRISIKQEITALESNEVSSPNRLLAIACRQLAENAESNNRYEEASRFRYWAMDLARRDKWKRWSFWKTDSLHMLYWAVSGYGEKIVRALGVLAAVWIVFVLLYTRVGFAQQPPTASTEGASSATAASTTIEDRIGQPLEFSRALTYSLAVMSLQKPEPRPLTNWAHTLVTLETILGPVQAALLALAIRRMFMR